MLFVGQQTFDGVPDVELPITFNRVVPIGTDSLPRARTGVVTPPPTTAELQTGLVTCSRTLLTTEQGTTDAIEAVTRTAGEGFPAGTVIYLDIEHMDAIPSGSSREHTRAARKIRQCSPSHGRSRDRAEPNPENR